jgi:hypothetical protein
MNQRDARSGLLRRHPVRAAESHRKIEQFEKASRDGSKHAAGPPAVMDVPTYIVDAAQGQIADARGARAFGKRFAGIERNFFLDVQERVNDPKWFGFGLALHHG